MKIEFTDKEVLLLLEIVSTSYMVEYLKGEDNSHIEALIQIIATQLKEAGKEEIFHKVFVQYRFK